jgi:hypothetical protein
MAAFVVASWRAAVMGRWAARILGTLMVLLFITFALGEGLPAPSQLTSIEKLQFVGVIGIVVGLLLAWKWEGLGGLLGVAGFILLVALSRSHLRMWVFWFPAVVVLVHVVCWTRLRAAAPVGLLAWNLPRGLVVSVLAVLAVFLILCADEIFGQPSLMTPALRPSADLTGIWHASLTQVLRKAMVQQIRGELTIHVDGTVTGTIGRSEIAQARIRYGRSWFGKVMRFNADYVIAGKLTNEVRVSTHVGGKQFTIPLMERAHTLTGSLFFAGQPMRLTLIRD